MKIAVGEVICDLTRRDIPQSSLSHFSRENYNKKYQVRLLLGILVTIFYLSIFVFSVFLSDKNLNITQGEDGNLTLSLLLAAQGEYWYIFALTNILAFSLLIFILFYNNVAPYYPLIVVYPIIVMISIFGISLTEVDDFLHAFFSVLAILGLPFFVAVTYYLICKRVMRMLAIPLIISVLIAITFGVVYVFHIQTVRDRDGDNPSKEIYRNLFSAMEVVYTLTVGFWIFVVSQITILNG
jgi:hypothetical protein